MKNSALVKFALGLMVVIAGWLVVSRLVRNADRMGERAFFYDASERKLFLAPRTAVPPIRGLNDATPDAFRAMVISTNGHPEDKASWTVAYLEKYSPDLKEQMETAQRTGTSPKMSRSEALDHRFVRRVEDSNWIPMSSPEAERIVTDWALPRAGITPVVCTP